MSLLLLFNHCSPGQFWFLDLYVSSTNAHNSVISRNLPLKVSEFIHRIRVTIHIYSDHRYWKISKARSFFTAHLIYETSLPLVSMPVTIIHVIQMYP